MGLFLCHNKIECDLCWQSSHLQWKLCAYSQKSEGILNIQFFMHRDYDGRSFRRIKIRMLGNRRFLHRWKQELTDLFCIIEIVIFDILKMNAKHLSFEQLLKNKLRNHVQSRTAEPKLIEIIAQWQLYPDEDYTLCFKEENHRQSYRSTALSRNTSNQSGMFDSWIQNQSMTAKSNKENMSHQPTSRRKKENEPVKVKMPIKTMAEMICQNVIKQREESKGSVESMKTLPHKENLKQEMNKITERKIQEISNLFKEDDSGKLQELIDSTEGIHTEIASLAKIYSKHAKKVNQEAETFENVFDGERENEAQKRRWQEAKNMLNGYLDKFKKPKFNQPVEKEESPKPSNTNLDGLHIGFSFAVNPSNTTQNNQLKIQHIHQAKSEMLSKEVDDYRHYDHSNRSSHLEIPSQAIQNIQSIPYRAEAESRVIENVPNSTLAAKLITSESNHRCEESMSSDSLGRVESRHTLNTVPEIEDIICKPTGKSELNDDKKPFSTKVVHIPKSSNQKLSIISSSKSKVGLQRSNKASPSTNIIEKHQVTTTAFNVFPPVEKVQERALTLQPLNNQNRSLLINPPKKSIKDVRSSIISPIPSTTTAIKAPLSHESSLPMFLKTQPNARSDNLQVTKKPTISFQVHEYHTSNNQPLNSYNSEKHFSSQLQSRLQTTDIRRCQIRYITHENTTYYDTIHTNRTTIPTHRQFTTVNINSQSSQVGSSSEFIFDI